MSSRLIFCSSILLLGCGAVPSAPVFSTSGECADDGGGTPFSIGRLGNPVAFVTYPYAAAIAPPIQPDGSSVFQIPSTIPFKIRVQACTPDGDPNGLSPSFSLERLGEDASSSTPVTVLESSSAADEGNTLRSAGLGQYLFNFSTKKSGFDSGGLTAGRYRLRISAGGAFADVVVEFQLRKS